MAASVPPLLELLPELPLLELPLVPELPLLLDPPLLLELLPELPLLLDPPLLEPLPIELSDPEQLHTDRPRTRAAAMTIVRRARTMAVLTHRPGRRATRHVRGFAPSPGTRESYRVTCPTSR